MKMLLPSKVDMDGMAPLHLALETGNEELAMSILKLPPGRSGGMEAVCDHGGSSPLHCAVKAHPEPYLTPIRHVHAISNLHPEPNAG